MKKKRTAKRVPDQTKRAVEELYAAGKIPLKAMEASFLLKVAKNEDEFYLPANEAGLEVTMLEKLESQGMVDSHSVMTRYRKFREVYELTPKGRDVLNKINARAQTLINQYTGSDFVDSVGTIETIKPSESSTQTCDKPMRKKTTSRVKTTAKPKTAAKRKTVAKKKTAPKKAVVAMAKKTTAPRAKRTEFSPAQKRQQAKIKQMNSLAVNNIYDAGRRNAPRPSWKQANKAAAKEVFK